MNPHVLVKNARISSSDAEPKNIGIHDGRIAFISDNKVDPGTPSTVVDAEGRWVIPGAIDTHAHIDNRAPEYDHLPGLGADDNFHAETASALAGGVTTALNYVRFGLDPMVPTYLDCVRSATEQSMINVLFHGYLMNMEHVSEISLAIKEGIRTFKLFMPYRGAEAAALGGVGSLNHSQMLIAFREIAAHGGQALIHAEDGDIVDHCMAHEAARGLDSLAGWERSRPVEAEGDASWTALYLAEKANCPATIVHVSSLEAIRARRACGDPNAALESCMHYMVLNTDEQIGPYGKVAPPLREASIADALTEAVMAGDIDFFGSDHNVWPAQAKTDWVSARPGLPGIGLMLPLFLTHFVHGQSMSMERAVELTSTNAANRFGLPGKGTIAIGADADLVILEEGERTVQANELHSAVDWSPYDGYVLRYWPHTTICQGSVVFDQGEFPNDAFRGEVINNRYRH
jgi:dihydropyrimidinase